MWDIAVGNRFAHIEQISFGYTKPWSRPAPKACHVRLQGSVATIGEQAILLEDSHPQAILKFHHSISLDYRAHHGLPVISKNYPEFLHEIHDSILINVIEQPFHSNYSAERGDRKS